MNQLQTIGDFLGALRRRAFLIASILVVGVIASVYTAINRPKVYQSLAVIQIESPSQLTRLAPGGATTQVPAATRVQLIEQRLMSSGSLSQVIEKFDLFSDTPLTAVQKVSLLRRSARIEGFVPPGMAWRPDAAPTALNVTVRMGDPVVAAQVANEFVERVLEQHSTRELGGAQENLEFMISEEREIQKKISDLDEKIAAFKRKHINELPNALGPQRELVTRLEENELDLEQEIVQLASGSGAGTRAEVNARRIAQLREQQALLRDRRLEVLALLEQAPEIERQLNGYNREMQQLQEQYSVITRNRSEAEMARQLIGNEQGERLEILEIAVPDYNPVAPNRKKLAAMGGFVSLALAVGVALALEMMKSVIRNSDQMTRQIGLTPVVSIPFIQTSRDRWRRRVTFIALMVGLVVVSPFILYVIDGYVYPLQKLSDLLENTITL